MDEHGLYYTVKIKQNLFTQDCWYNLKEGSTLEVIPTNEHGDDIPDKKKFFKTLKDITIHINGQYPIEEIKQ